MATARKNYSHAKLLDNLKEEEEYFEEWEIYEVEIVTLITVELIKLVLLSIFCKIIIGRYWLSLRIGSSWSWEHRGKENNLIYEQRRSPLVCIKLDLALYGIQCTGLVFGNNCYIGRYRIVLQSFIEFDFGKGKL